MTRPLVELQTWEFDLVSLVGARRASARWHSGNAAHYDQKRMEDERTAQVAACAAELAVAKWTNRYWHAHVWDARDHDKFKDLPDVGTNIEVRRVRTSDSAAVREHQVGKRLVLFVAKPIMPELRSVEILGWFPYDLAWQHGTPSDYAQNTRLLDPKHLRLEIPK